MTAKEYLSQYAALSAEIKSLNEEKRRLEGLATNISHSNNGGSRSGVSDKVGNLSAKIADLSNDIESKTSALVDLMKEIENAIQSIDDSTCRTLLRNKYINGMNWEKVAESMNYSVGHIVHELHPKSLKKITQNLHKYT